MQYLSPVSILGGSVSVTGDKKNFLLEKKKLLAELELSGGSTVVINGRELSKNDIIQFFDKLQQADDLSYHIAIANDKTLLQFLEEKTIDPNTKFQVIELYSDIRFVNWISPYYCESAKTLAERCLRDLDTDGWVALFSKPAMMNGHYSEKLWQSIERRINQDKEFLEFFVDEDPGTILAAEREALCDFRYVTMVVQLPEDRFRMLRDDYAVSMMRVCIRIFNSNVQNRSKAMSLLHNAGIMAVSEETKAAIVNKGEEMDGIMTQSSRSTSTSSGGDSAWGVIKIIFFLILAVWKISTCDSDNNRSNFEFTPPVYKREHYSREYIDSLLNLQRGTREITPSNSYDTVIIKSTKKPKRLTTP